MHAVKAFLGVNCTVCSMAGYWKSASKVKQTLIYIYVMLLVLWWLQSCQWLLVVDVAFYLFSQTNAKSSLRQCRKLFIASSISLIFSLSLSSSHTHTLPPPHPHHTHTRSHTRTPTPQHPHPRTPTHSNTHTPTPTNAQTRAHTHPHTLTHPERERESTCTINRAAHYKKVVSH